MGVVMHEFEETKTCRAMFYLEDHGYAFFSNLTDETKRAAEIRKKFLEVVILEDLNGYMLYVGEGFVPLVVAVAARNESDALASFEEWCRKNDRHDEINETDDVSEEEWGVYNVIIQKMPRPIVVMPIELDHG